jgi:hypothetical protein
MNTSVCYCGYATGSAEPEQIGAPIRLAARRTVHRFKPAP